MSGMEAREAFCHLLASVYTADGVLTDSEKHALEEAMMEHGLDDDERRRVLLLSGHEQALKVMRDRPAGDRQLLLDELVAAALADGRLTPTETEMVKQIGAALDGK